MCQIDSISERLVERTLQKKNLHNQFFAQNTVLHYEQNRFQQGFLKFCFEKKILQSSDIIITSGETKGKISQKM